MREILSQAVHFVFLALGLKIDQLHLSSETATLLAEELKLKLLLLKLFFLVSSCQMRKIWRRGCCQKQESWKI